MAPTFEADLAAALRELAAARHELRRAIESLSDAALDRARRGGWSVRRVLQHIIESELYYAHHAARLRGLPAAALEEERPSSSVPEALRRLGASREALLAAVAGVDEASFYRLAPVGHAEYSLLSLLENVANHDREHAQQIQSTLAAE